MGRDLQGLLNEVYDPTSNALRTSGGTGAQAPGAGAAPDLWGASLIAPPLVVSAAPAVWTGANTAWFQRCAVPVKRAYRYALFAVGVQSGNIQVGVVRLSGTSLLTYTRVMDSGVIACPASGDIRLDLGSLSLQAGDYAMFMWADNTTATLPIGGVSAAETRMRLFSTVASLSTGVPGSGSLSDWAGNRAMGLLIEADV